MQIRRRDRNQRQRQRHAKRHKDRPRLERRPESQPQQQRHGRDQKQPREAGRVPVVPADPQSNVRRRRPISGVPKVAMHSVLRNLQLQGERQPRAGLAASTTQSSSLCAADSSDVWWKPVLRDFLAATVRKHVADPSHQRLDLVILFPSTHLCREVISACRKSPSETAAGCLTLWLRWLSEPPVNVGNLVENRNVDHGSIGWLHDRLFGSTRSCCSGRIRCLFHRRFFHFDIHQHLAAFAIHDAELLEVGRLAVVRLICETKSGRLRHLCEIRFKRVRPVGNFGLHAALHRGHQPAGEDQHRHE